MNLQSLLFKNFRTFSELAFVSETSGEDGFDVDAHRSSRRVLATNDSEAELPRSVRTSVEHRFKYERRQQTAATFSSRSALFGSS